MVTNKATTLLMVGKAESVFTATAWAWLVFFEFKYLGSSLKAVRISGQRPRAAAFTSSKQ